MPDITNYQGLTTNSPDGAWNAGPLAINDLKTSGAGTEMAAAVAAGKYSIDIEGDVRTYQAMDYPLLTLISNAGSIGENTPYIFWNDEYDQDSWIDIALDNLRLRSTFESGSFDIGGSLGATAPIRPYSIDNSNQKGGKIEWKSVGTLPAGDIDASMSAAAEVALNSNKELIFGFDTSGIQTIGGTEMVIRKLDNMLRNLGYEATEGLGNAKEYYKLAYNNNVKAPAYVAFDNISYTTDGGTTIENDNEVIARVQEFYFSNDLSQVIFNISLYDSNIHAEWDATASNNVVCLEEIASGDGTVFDSVGSGYFRIARMALIGKPVQAPLPIAEGSRLNKTGGFIRHRERKGTYTQIFDTDMYGITGTAQATKFRFGDGFKETRATYLKLFKAKQEAAGLFGIKYETYAVSDDGFENGKPVRATSGLLDYAMYPMKYFKTELPAYITAGSNDGGVEYLTWLNDLIAKAAAFRQKGARNLTFLVSQDFLNYMNRQNAFIGSQQGGNITGGIWTAHTPSKLTYGLKIYEYSSPEGSVNFIHEPMLDNQPSLPVPNFIFGKNVNPRKLMLSIDTANIRRHTLRGDKIMGNLQENDRDGFLEGMRGEHGFSVRFPRNNTLIYWGD
jgi:hypothetical protein